MTPPAAAATAVNGEARTGVAVLAQRMDDCQHIEEQRWNDNSAQHEDVFKRLGKIEVELGKQGVRVGIWATLGAMIGSALVGGAIQLALKFMAGGGK